uniref:Uncharacterized protein n=1 Tax=Leptobrachium leishanense TaxID=445787 RepID=A0A8C5QIE0_9ANUR
MRSQLLISVAQLPTISEDAEASAQCGQNGADFYKSNGLDEYVKSIQTLAQPSSLMNLGQQGQVRSQRRCRVRVRSSRCGDGKLLSVTQNATCRANVLALQTNADPLAWLYRQTGKENKDCTDSSESELASLPQTLHSVIPKNLLKTTMACRKQVCIRDQAIDTQRLQEKRSRTPRLTRKCRSQGVVSRLQNPQLPVIYEL